MATKDRLTNSSDETDIASLFSGDVIFSIPFFQRPYKWKPDKLRQLERDLLALVDEVSDFHFFGAVIIHGRRSNPSDPDVFDVIDGQQRLTTLFLYLCAFVRHLSKNNREASAASLLQKYLVIPRAVAGQSNLKLHPCSEDRAQLNAVFKELLSENDLKSALGGFEPTFLKYPAHTKDAGRLRSNFRAAVRFLDTEHENGGDQRIDDILRSLLNLMSVVQIDVKDPASGPKIFDSLNSKQEPMTIGDLVRNGIFSRVADEEPDLIERVEEEHWQPFYRGFEHDGKNAFDMFFFPYGLISDPNLTKSRVYSHLQREWERFEKPAEIIAELSRYQDGFMDLVMGTDRQGLGKEIFAAKRRLFDLGAPSSTLPFLMRLLGETAEGTVSTRNCLAILSLVEAFLVRRAIIGIEPTGLHAVFKRLWADCDGDYSKARVEQEMKKHRTVAWPKDEQVTAAIKGRELYGSTITKFLILEFDRSLEGDAPSDILEIEHVYPQRPVSEWEQSIPKVVGEKLRHTLANLLPLSSPMNKSIKNSIYETKQKRYREDSMFKSTRDFAQRYNKWTPEAIEERAESLALWANSRWQG